MKRWMLGLVTLIAISLVGAATASAQGGGYGCGAPVGGYSTGYGGYSAGYGGYAPGYSAYSGNGGYAAGYSGNNFGYRGSSWHNTSHLDYHPASVQRHRLHFHYVPGHYDVHRSGHRH